MAKEPNYRQLQEELEQILDDLQRDDIDVDEAMECYRRGLEITAKLEAYLKSAENTITELKAKFSAEA